MGGGWSVNKYDAFHAAIGRFVLNWADLEMGLDALVLAVARQVNTPKGPLPAPHQLGAKICFLRKHAGSIPEWKPYLRRLKAILKRIDTLAPTRNDFVHGAIMEHQERPTTLKVTLWRMLQPKKGPRRPAVKVTTGRVKQTARRIYVLTDELLDLVSELYRIKLERTPAKACLAR